ncbi:MAG: tetratricopeptide repeat protein, partial [Bacteroidales bacterium]|nr:tetratricopeptide repeat protein [Bacteroidales bacterium]
MMKSTQTSPRIQFFDILFRKSVVALLFVGMGVVANGQTLAQAQKWFNNGEFEKAKPVFRKLTRQAPSNATYNFWYGACLYETGEKDAAEPYLEKAVKRDVINAFRYLGKLRFDQYRFDEAVENYEEHIEWLTKKKRDTELAEKELEKVRQGSLMIKGVERITVIDSMVVDKQNFLAAYKLSQESGRIFQDADKAGSSYCNEMENRTIHSDMNDGKLTLFGSTRLLHGWSQPERLGGMDESTNINNPFMLGDGQTLYFASDGEESLGGYDIFVTRYNAEDNTFLKPSNIGMPFNSPDNDFMLAIDEYNNIGWFASDRRQPAGKVCIYIYEPNPTKIVYDFDNTDQELLTQVASLSSIGKTWGDANRVRLLKEQLSEILEGKEKKAEKHDV